MHVSRLDQGQVPGVVDVFTDAFSDYPVMRYVLGPAEPYEERLRRLVELFVSSRAYRNEPMLGLRDDSGALVGAATMTLPRSADPPALLLDLREVVWGELGPDARARYDAFATATQQFAVPEPHYHLNMIGVRRAYQGRGLARTLLQAVHDIAGSDDTSSGVTLTTEHPPNVRLYEHFGYRVRGHARVGDSLESWTLYRDGRSP